MKKHIYHLSCNQFDTQIGVVENSGKCDDMEETAIRIYDVGRTKDDDDEAVSSVGFKKLNASKTFSCCERLNYLLFYVAFIFCGEE